MGVCNSDPLGYLIGHYGNQFTQYIISVKSQQYLNVAVPKLYERLQEQLDEFSLKLEKNLQSKEKTMNQIYNQTLEQTKSSSPVELQMAKKYENKDQRQLFGFNSQKVKFEKLKSSKDEAIKQEKQQILRLLETKKQALISQSIKERCKMPLYDQMPIWLKQRVLQDSQQRFACEIKKKQEYLEDLLQKTIDIQNIQNKTLRFFDNQGYALIDLAKNTFEKTKKGLSYSSNLHTCFV